MLFYIFQNVSKCILLSKQKNVKKTIKNQVNIETKLECIQRQLIHIAKGLDLYYTGWPGSISLKWRLRGTGVEFSVATGLGAEELLGVSSLTSRELSMSFVLCLFPPASLAPRTVPSRWLVLNVCWIVQKLQGDRFGLSKRNTFPLP